MRVLFVLCALLSPRLEAGPAVRVLPSLVKVRPDRPLPSGARAEARLTAARGECEAFHLVVTDAGGRGTRLREVESRPWRHGDSRLEAKIYREDFITVATPSSGADTRGEWPDALVPVRDDVAGEKRRAFPVDIAAERHQPVLVELCVPPDAPPGEYRGEVVVRANGWSRRIAGRLEVVPVTVPATSSLPVTFGLSGRNVMLGHFGEKRSDVVRVALVERYARLALAYRVSLHTMTRLMPAWRLGDDGSMEVDFSAWDAELAPLMDGERRMSATDLRLADDLPRSAWGDYAKAVRAHFGERGWDDRLFVYAMDEPREDQRAELVSRLESLGGGVPRLVTMPFDASLAGLVDLWAPNLNCFAHKQRTGEFCRGETPRDAYPRDAKVWWYQSCSSHGCGHGRFGDGRDDYFSGWPSYMVDADGASARVMGWQAFRHSIEGELYFDTVHAYGRWERTHEPRLDPWEDLFAFGGNGDGTLFYPGRPDRIGGHTDVPVASLRLVHIRDGLEDWELLRQAAVEHRAQAEAIAAELAPQLFEASHDPATFERSRARLFELLKKQ
ncbi:MAG: hypothetical protein RL199_2058 [Pseudomonadota bacterium]|jgi:hypothetical protein